ncbi:MAG: DEAD/DEAH box helicase [Thermoplasmata archaeon]
MIQENIIDKLRQAGIENLTEDQINVYDTVYSGRNMLLIAPTGSGKTEAAIIPILARIHDERPKGIYAIYITPLRSLNRDLFERIMKYATLLDVSVNIRHGDSTKYERKMMLENIPELLITTPETLQILFSGKKIKEYLRNVRTVIVDEIHELVQDERGWQLSVAIERLQGISGKIQRIGLSATVGNQDEIARFLSPGDDVKIFRSTLIKEFDVRVEAPSRIYREESDIMMCDPEYGSAIMHVLELVERRNSSLIFVNTRFTAEDIAMRLKKINKDLEIGVHHGSLSKDVRIENEKLLKEGKLKALICTSSLELGIDVGGTEFIVQFNSPRQVYRLIQRLGRSGHRLGHVSRGAIVSGDPVELEEAVSVVDLMKRGWIEELRVRKNPYVVLANQIVAWVYSEGSLEIEMTWEIIRRSYPFRDLRKEELIDFIGFLERIRMVRFDGKYIHRGSRSLEYFYDNISMIPDERNYRVIDLSTNKFIGILDETFVSQEVAIGQTFVMKGITWRVIDIKEDMILVEFVEEIGNPPKWIGEDIPVPFEIAVNVSNLRSKGQIPEYVNESCANKLKEWWALDHAGTDRIRISRNGPDTLIEDWFGTRVNETLALIISGRLREEGTDVSIGITPYTIVISSNDLPVDEKYVRKILLEERDIIDDIEKYIPYSRFFPRVFTYVAKKFGVISKDADLASIKIEKVMDIYRDTYIYREAIEKSKWDFLDIKNTQDVLERIRRNEIKIEITGFDRSMESYLNYMESKSGRTKLTPSVLNAIRTRLMNQEMIFVCLDCKSSWTRKVEEVNDTRCIYCGSVRVTALRKFEREKVSIIKNGPRTKEEKEFYEKAMNISNLIRIYRKEAILALAGRGIGHDTALRILRTPHSDVLSLVKDIAEAELNFARTKKYWRSS